MATWVKHYLHDSTNTSNVVLGTSLAAANYHAHDMAAGLPSFFAEPPFRGRIESIHVRLISIVTATKVTVSVSLDAAGNYGVIPATEATLDPNLTTAAAGCAAFSVGIPVSTALVGGTTLYLHASVDAGSATLDASCITWSE